MTQDACLGCGKKLENANQYFCNSHLPLFYCKSKTHKNLATDPAHFNTYQAAFDLRGDPTLSFYITCDKHFDLLYKSLFGQPGFVSLNRITSLPNPLVNALPMDRFKGAR